MGSFKTTDGLVSVQEIIKEWIIYHLSLITPVQALDFQITKKTSLETSDLLNKHGVRSSSSEDSE